MLKIFGSEVSWSSKIYPSARVDQPWNLALSRFTSIGPFVHLYCLSKVSIGSYTRVSFRSTVCSATHDYNDASFPLLRQPVSIGSNVWIASEAFIGPGVTVGNGSVIGARAVCFSDIPDNVVAIGNPSMIIKSVSST
ncbi:putative colanic acid biosynthesis acetyltransferase [Synechococcus sp. NOUM97013]|uniref:putative colanic acid biosynthesis acetyltransferase n=1 Tax=Synechococcus sp. NOUM97013 TaxID=1442555 RepID=UPI001647CA41|nr:putative colanic acid biosynthesis acetyltransferase [Synechococcus sp. NOUM97013]